LVAIALTITACGDTIVNVPTTPTPTTPATPPVVRSTIEFRVVGNASSVRVRYSAPADGLTQVVTTLPYQNSFVTTAESMFLSLEGTPVSYPFAVVFPFLSIQIVVNGNTFREATANEFLLNTLQVSGTWRR